MNILKKIFDFIYPPITDEVFGELYREGKNAWQGWVPFQHEPTRTTALLVTIETPDKKSRPSAEQRALFQQIAERYATLWPEIAAALAEANPHLGPKEQITRFLLYTSLELKPVVPGTISRWTFQYTFDHPDEGDMGYFVEFENWKIIGLDAGD